VRLWDATTGVWLQTLEGHTREVISVAFSTDGSRLASASYDKTVRLWDATTGVWLQTLEGYTDGGIVVAFLTDDSRLASASYNKTVRLWDATTGAWLQTLEGHIMLSFISESPSFNTKAVSSYHLRENGSWIAWKNDNILWLPKEYRSLYARIKGDVFITISYGRVIVIKYKKDITLLKR
jgi:WD40 repeat protein